MKISVPNAINAPLITNTTKATRKAGIKAVNERDTPYGTDSGIFIINLCLTQKR